MTNNFTYISIDTTYSREGSHNYTNISLLDGFYYKGPLTNLTSHTLLNLQQNSNHFPLKLTLPQHTLLARPPCQTHQNLPRLLNPISQNKLDAFNQHFFTQHSLLINELTTFFQPSHLSLAQWNNVCSQLDSIISLLSFTLQQTCIVLPIPILIVHTNSLGGYLIPRNIQKTWKKHLSTHHFVSILFT